jgi:two-component system invasion response regulator UvrY
MIRAVIIDGHPAMRAGIEAILARTDDVVVVAGTSGEPHEVAHALYRTAPDVIIVEHTAHGHDGVALARVVKARPPAPKVIVYADGVEATLVATAMLAGADALVDSRGDARELVAAVRSVAEGRPQFPELDSASRAALARCLPSQDEPILRMFFAAVAPREIARSLKLDARTLRARLAAMIERLGGAPAPAGC